MTSTKKFKRDVRARMARTGESYVAAHAALADLTKPVAPAPIAPIAPTPRAAAATKSTKRYYVCDECGHVRSLHVPPEKATAGSHGCMHEDVANGFGGAGDWCSCTKYVEVIRDSYRGYTSSVGPSDEVTETA